MDDAQQLNTIASLIGGQLPSLKFNSVTPSIKSLPSITSGVSNLIIPENSSKWNNLGNIGGLSITRKAGKDYKMSNGLQTGLTTATTVLDSVVPDNLDASQKAMKSSMKSLISLAGPIGTAINFADSGLNMIGSIAGLQLDKMDNVAASRAGVSSAGLNNTIMSIPVVGSLGGFMAASFTDLIQSIVMTIAIVVVFGFGISKVGSFSAVMDNAKSMAGYFSLTHTHDVATGTASPYSLLQIFSTLAWGLSMGTDIGGSATPIGASANVVGMSVIAKEGHIVGWGKYCKSAVPATIIVMVVATVGIWLRYC